MSNVSFRLVPFAASLSSLKRPSKEGPHRAHTVENLSTQLLPTMIIEDLPPVDDMDAMDEDYELSSSRSCLMDYQDPEDGDSEDVTITCTEMVSLIKASLFSIRRKPAERENEERLFDIFGRDGTVVAKFHLPPTVTVNSGKRYLNAKVSFRGIDLSISFKKIDQTFILDRANLFILRPGVQDEKTRRRRFLVLLKNRRKYLKANKVSLTQQASEETIVSQCKCANQIKEITEKNEELKIELANKTSVIKSLSNELDTLKQKFSKQAQELRTCYDQVVELKGNLRVYCRCRPLSSQEVARGEQPVVDYDIYNINELYVNASEGQKKVFKFDRIFSPEHDQAAVFKEVAPLVVSVLDGFNVCIFAYGQTGTGKTFTMQGSESNRGVNYRTLEKLFNLAAEREGHFEYNMFVSVLEVYNEEIRDLLAPSGLQNGKKLEVKQISEGVHHVPGVVEAPVTCVEQAWKVLEAGGRGRAVGSTNANKHSSRSHGLVCIVVKGENVITGETVNSKLWLIDLAGSERVGKTDAQGDRLKEAQNINKSLSALGDVIHALAKRSSHVPYRNSKLTHLLQDSLGGQSKTLMLVQISPSGQDVGETLCSLNFASRARGIEFGCARKQADPAELGKYKKMVEKANQDAKQKDELIKELQEALKVKDQSSKLVSNKVKEIENEKKARTIAEDKLREQRSINDKQKQLIDKLTADLKANNVQESKRLPSVSNLPQPKRPPLHDRGADNRLNNYQRPRKRTADAYLQKENIFTDSCTEVVPTKIPSKIVVPPRNDPGNDVFSENGVIDETFADEVEKSEPQTRNIASPRRQTEKSHKDLPDFSLPPVGSRRRGRNSLCILPDQKHPFPLPPSPMLNLPTHRRRPSLAGPMMPRPEELDSFDSSRTAAARPPRLPPPSMPACGKREWNSVEEESQGSRHKARRISIAGNSVHGNGRPPAPQSSSREIPPRRVFGEETNPHTTQKMRRSSFIPSWERPQSQQVWAPIMTPGGGHAAKKRNNMRRSSTFWDEKPMQSMSSSAPSWPSLPPIPSTPGIPFEFGGAQRVPQLDRKRASAGGSWNK
uniref:Kinesin 14-IIIb protein n=1 Tax=Marsilea vestita TaxID=59764 RepID=A0A142KWD2_MARVE|nr:kinesin 14-IIIb protein [Marsilea vestita]